MPGRIIGKKPKLGKSIMGGYVAGLFAGEGFSTCVRLKGKRPAPCIGIAMCDKDVLADVASRRGVSVTRMNKGACPKNEDNPEGRYYRVTAIGERARVIVEDMIQNGLKGSKVRQWQKVLTNCPV